MEKVLDRTTFVTKRALEFFTESELSMQIGQKSSRWAVAVLKELIDNALDACETAGGAPHIRVIIQDNALAVEDNGPGLPLKILERSLDYDIRVSDKVHYVSPTRGQLGNALKCVWAAPFVIDGKRGCVEVDSNGMLHRVDITLDALEQQPRITVAQQFLDGKLRQAGVRKVLPKSAVLRKAFRRAWRLEMVQRAVDEALQSQADDLVIPTDLAGTLRRKLKNEAISWDQGLQQVVRRQQVALRTR
jgi:DNA topoisomerase VI subunit B